jgi:hypothetical protein
MENKAKYILDLFKCIYNINNEYDINYGINNQSKIQIKTGNVEYFKKRQELSLKNIIWKKWNGEQIPFLFDTQDNDIISFSDEGAIINFDIIASGFYLLSGWQEYVTTNRDQYGRFQYRDSIQHKLDIIYQPTVNYYFNILKYAVEKVYKAHLTPRFWSNKDFAVFVSHDIDTCESAWKEAGFWQLKNGNYKVLFKLIYNKIKGKDGWFNFNEILQIEKDLGINSTFFFISDSTPSNGIPNGDYKLSQKKFQAVFENIINHNSEIGLHTSFRSPLNSDTINNEMNRIPADVIGNRFHFLNFDVKHTPHILNNTNLKYDSTFGFAESAGFRSSFCLPYFLYDIENDQQTSVIEIPLIFMDTSLRLKNYMNLSHEEITALSSKLIGEIKKNKGLFTINWHNTMFSNLKEPGWDEIFNSIVDTCKEFNCQFLNGKQVNSFFNQKH